MNGKKAKLLRKLALSATVGEPHKVYKTRRKGHAQFMGKDKETGEKKFFIFPDEVVLDMSTRKVYQELKRKYRNDHNYRKRLHNGQ